MIRLIFILVVTLPLTSIAALPKVMWTATFTNTMPNRAGVTQAFCDAHAPDNYTVTTQHFIKQGAKTANGILVKGVVSNDYTKYGLFLHDGSAILEGTIDGKPWTTTMHFYSHSLTLNGPGHGVWASDDCKGIFTFTGKEMTDTTPMAVDHDVQ